MQFLILMNIGKARGTPREATATRECGEAPATAGGPHPLPPTAPVRFSARKMSVVDGPFPETKQ